ncbi:MAG: selenide, water dikinase SelD [Spirochaetia bacterium]|nr:selenide, water dikinase SelD [Spirochaetia bacterium]
MGPEALAQVLRPLAALVPPERAPDLVAGFAEGDDAAVYRLNDEQCLIFTADFFTPVVDDPYDFGAIAAANALSDVYATGGVPILALNLAAFPPELDQDVVRHIIRGGAETASAAGCAVAGGHTITDAEPKFGMAVVGLAHPDQVLLKSGAVPGDALILTKVLGTGAVTTAAKNGRCTPEQLAAAVDSMKLLNRDALMVLRRHGVRACTDITGFSFAGHALELAGKGSVGLRVNADNLRYLDGARELTAAGQVPGGAIRNRRCYEPMVGFDGNFDEAWRALFFMPETSGGLLAAIPAERASACVDELRQAGIVADRVGDVVAPDGGPPLRVSSG